MAITNAVTVDSLNGNFKEVYANKVENLSPEGLKAMGMFKFVMGDKQTGNKYH
jgi:hypothetical protein